MTSRGVTKHRSMGEWLNSKAPGKGRGGAGKLKWKDFDKGLGSVDTWMHTKTLPMTVWRHPFPALVVVEDKQSKEKVTHVYPRGHTCHETETVLDKLYWREEKGVPNSARSAPPERCAICKFTEYVWLECWAWLETHRWDAKTKEWKENKPGKGKGIDPCAVLFRFVSEASDKETTTIHAGGFCGLFGRKEIPDDLGKAMAAHKLRQSDAWKESCMVKAKSVMCVLDNDDIQAGIQVSEETKELGEKVKEEIVRMLKSTDIDIQREPYCIRWEYDKKQNMGKQYTATAIMKIKPSPRVLKLIRDDSPDLGDLTTPFDQQAMRSIFERHCKIKSIPWDEIFPSKEQEKQWAEEDDASARDDEDSGEGAGDNTSSSDSDENGEEGETSGDEVEEDEDGDELVGCDACGKPMKITASKCPHCGKAYEVEEEPEAEPESVKKPRTRAEVMAEKKATATKASGKKKSEPEPEESGDDTSDADEDAAGEDNDDDNQGDSIPF